MKAKNIFIQEAANLKDKVERLASIIYLNGTIINFDDFQKLLFVLKGGYKVVDPNHHVITVESLSKEYIQNLPQAIEQLHALHEEVKDFMARVKNRSAYILKF